MAATAVSRSSRADSLQQRLQHYAPAHYSPSSLSDAPKSLTNTRSNQKTMVNHVANNQPRPPKRPLEEPEQQESKRIKRRRSNHFVVEIPAKPASQRFLQAQGQNNSGRPHTGNRPSLLPAPHPRTATKVDPTKHPEPVAPTVAPPVAAAAIPPPPEPVDVKKTVDAPKLTKHKKKVANGLKHELDRLQPSVADIDTQTQGRRKLRSQEAIRFKSELSAYFPDYDEVIGNDPKETYLLNADTPTIINDTQTGLPTQTSSNTTTSITSYPSHDKSPAQYEGDSSFFDVVDAQRFDLDCLETITRSDIDPLSEAVYAQSHKKAQRVERSLRNAERSRAQHERDQVIRLFGGLQGPDWLKIMGVSGVTESKKKTYESARAHFIKGCHAIIDKFKAWAAEEKRRKQEKDRLARGHTAAEEEAERKPEEKAESEGKAKAGPQEEKVIPDSQADAEDEVMTDADGDMPDASDVDASIARQLREEAMAAARAKSRPKLKSLCSVSGQTAVKPPSPVKDKEFKSFFAKPSQRTQALNKNRRKGRNALLAWGQPLPPLLLEEKSFELPEEYRSEDPPKANTRTSQPEKRRRKIGHAVMSFA